MKTRTPIYPQPKAQGGHLIREVISLLREQGLSLPITSRVVIAISGGPDSVALASLLIRYGRRVVDRSKIRLLHINHGWRGRESSKDENFVRIFARRFKVPLRVVHVVPPAKYPPGESWEDVARRFRKKIFQTEMNRGAYLLTAHQADDLAETMLWRLLTGASATHGAGIWAIQGKLVRPFLTIRKNRLQVYLKEESLRYCKDRSNDDSRFMRARIRKELIPVMEEIFPKATQHLIELALQNQKVTDYETKEFSPLQTILQASGMRTKRSYWEQGKRLMSPNKAQGELHLEGGWILLKKRRGEVVLKKRED